MKSFFLVLSLLFTGILNLNAQDKAFNYREELPTIFLDDKSSLHIISPEPIRFVDISTNSVAGDLPEAHVLRLRHVTDSLNINNQVRADLGLVTIIGESFIAQYNLQLTAHDAKHKSVARVDITSQHIKPISSNSELTTPELHQQALRLLTKRNSRPLRVSSDYGMRAELGAVYTVGDLVLLDISYYNHTNIQYDIDEVRFKIEDRKITKATNVQSIEIKPIWQLYPHKTFQKLFRNIYVLKKATFPDNKILQIELSEKQISGRTLSLKVKYKDILNADTF